MPRQLQCVSQRLHESQRAVKVNHEGNKENQFTPTVDRRPPPPKGGPRRPHPPYDAKQVFLEVGCLPSVGSMVYLPVPILPLMLPSSQRSSITDRKPENHRLLPKTALKNASFKTNKLKRKPNINLYNASPK